jgi:4-amino-4-deoxy-L-arabinose transferase
VTVQRKSFEYNYFIMLVVVYFLALQFRPVFSPNEVKCAEVIREMVMSGDLFSWQLNSEAYKEGVLPGLQLSALLAKIFHPWRFVLRLLSFGSVCCCAWLMYYFFRIKKYSRLTAQFAVCLFLTMPTVFIVGTSVMPDMFFVLLTILCYGVLYSCQERFTRIYSAVLVYLCSGMIAGFACCMKDFSGLLLPLTAFTLFLITSKRWKDLLLFPGIMFIESLMILLLWNLLIPHVEYVHLLSDLTAVHTRFGIRLCSLKSVLFLIAGGILWLPFFVASCIGLGKKLWNNNMLRMTVLFLVVALLYYILFDASLASCLFILFPMTVLTAAGMRSFLIRYWGERLLNTVAGTLLFFDLAAVVLFFIGFFTNLPLPVIFYKDEAWLWLLAIVFLISSAVGVIFLFSEKRLCQKIRCLLFAFFPFFLILMCVYPRAVAGQIAPASLLKNIPAVSHDTMIATVTDLLPDVCWGLKRRDIVLLDSGNPTAEWMYRLGNKKFASVLLVLKERDYERGMRYGIFPDNAVWYKKWDRDVPCVLVKYQYNTKDLKK